MNFVFLSKIRLLLDATAAVAPEAVVFEFY